MLNINELEQRWLRYKIKSYIPHTIISISLLSIISITLIVLNKEDIELLNSKKPVENLLIADIKTIKIQAEEKIIQPTRSIPKQKVVTLNKKTPTKTTNNINTKMTITPSLDFMKKMQDNTLSNYENNLISEPYNQYRNDARSKPVEENKKPKKKETIIVKEETTELTETKNIINIKRQNTHDDISQVVSRFNKNNNPALSLFIAKKYYELGDYSKSYNYALITNEINSEIEASWIVFAKSLVKLQKKEQAIKILKKYINHSNSNRANILLDDIVSGKFK